MKDKGYVLNPRGKPLYDDANRFGTKMLEKMGWSKGKGLGANMDGDQNFVRISHKADQKGIGYADRDDQWTCHASSFNNLLKSLDDGSANSDAEHSDKDNAEDGGAFSGFGFGTSDKKKKSKKTKGIKEKLSGKSLEEMSKSSGVRVHYKKFTRGKDISRYSEKDLANIFGKKVSNDEDETEQIEPSAENENEDLSYGITTVETGTTINDYFKKKKSKKSKRDIQENIIDSTQNEPEPIPNAAIADDSEIIDVDFFAEERKRKKKEKKRKRSEAAIDEEPIEIADSPQLMQSVEIKKKKKKKKKKEKKDQEIVDTSEIVTLDDSNDSNEMIVEKPPKLKKRKKNEKTAPNDNTEVTSTDHQPIENSQFFKTILDTIMTVNHSGDSSTELKQSTVATAQPTPVLAETYELNRFQAEMFRFVDLNGFPNANISDLSGYGFSKNIDLKITAKSQDHSRINDLWDYALINKYGKDVIRTKKNKRYSIKTLKKKSLFKAL